MPDDSAVLLRMTWLLSHTLSFPQLYFRTQLLIPWQQVFPLYPMDSYSVGFSKYPILYSDVEYSETSMANNHSIMHNWIMYISEYSTSGFRLGYFEIQPNKNPQDTVKILVIKSQYSPSILGWYTVISMLCDTVSSGGIAFQGPRPTITILPSSIVVTY